MKRIIKSLLILSALFLMFFVLTVSASANTLAQEQAKFPDGKYWNHVSSGTNHPQSGSLPPNNPNGITSIACSDHPIGPNACDFYGNCGCNSYDMAEVNARDLQE
jgi:hypothetical protein